MIYLENKLDLFKKIVYDKRRVANEKKLQETKARVEETFEKKQGEFSKTAADFIKRREQMAKTKRFEMLSKAMEEQRIDRLRKDEELLDELLKDLSKKILSFQKTEEYITFTKEKYENTLESLNPGEYVLYLLKQDENRLNWKEIAEAHKISVEIEEMLPETLGGFIIEDKGATYRIDMTFLSKLEECRYDIGKLLHFSLGDDEDEKSKN